MTRREILDLRINTTSLIKESLISLKKLEANLINIRIIVGLSSPILETLTEEDLKNVKSKYSEVQEKLIIIDETLNGLSISANDLTKLINSTY